jgi:hypothetical protein
MFKLLTACLTLLLIAFPAAAEKTTITIETPSKPTVEVAPPAADAPFAGQRSAVDVAILLDTSNSMDGLIDQAKRQLWTVVGRFAQAQKAGQTPILRVALFEYGNTNLPASEGYIRQVVPLTDDLDKLSEKLFALTTNGGDEYCGQVIYEAVQRLDWSREPGSYKAIFIAGNEPFTQGEVDYRESTKKAIEKGIVVNTIHCGNYQAGIDGQWRDGAKLAEGDYLNIDQDRTVVHIDAPQDEIIIKLNAQLNETYLWYGERSQRVERLSNQAAQDRNAAEMAPSVAVQRANAKISKAYSNVGRDLVDSVAEDEAVLDQVPEAELPEAMQEMRQDERKAHVDEMAKKRAELQKKIAELNAERAAYIASEKAKRAEAAGQADAEKTLGDAMLEAIDRQLEASGFEVQ